MQRPIICTVCNGSGFNYLESMLDLPCFQCMECGTTFLVETRSSPQSPIEQSLIRVDICDDAVFETGTLLNVGKCAVCGRLQICKNASNIGKCQRCKKDD